MFDEVLPMIKRDHFEEFRGLIPDLPSYDQWQENMIATSLAFQYRSIQQFITPGDFFDHMQYSGGEPSVRQLWLCARNLAGDQSSQRSIDDYNFMERQ